MFGLLLGALMAPIAFAAAIAKLNVANVPSFYLLYRSLSVMEILVWFDASNDTLNRALMGNLRLDLWMFLVCCWKP